MEDSDFRGKCIALDIGNVCIHLQHAQALAHLGYSADHPIPFEFLAAIDAFERGKITEEEWMAAFRQATDGRFDDTQLRDAYNIIIGPEIDGMYDTLKEIVDNGYRLIFFSDTSEPHILYSYRVLSIMPLVTGSVFSYDVGAKKPEPEMYEWFEREFGQPAFYVDDKPENIEAGKQRGWTSHQFTSVESFREAVTEELF